MDPDLDSATALVGLDRTCSQFASRSVRRISLQTGVTLVAWEVVPQEGGDAAITPPSAITRSRFSLRSLRSRGG
jgi:hypothetical protein